MISDATNNAAIFHGKVLLVAQSQRHIVEDGLRKIGIDAEWTPSVYGIEPYRDVGGPKSEVYLWSLIVPTEKDVALMQAWLDSRPEPDMAH